MRIAKRISVLTGAALAAAGLAVAGAPAASAAPIGPTLTASPVSVYQLPALGLQISGLAVPWPLFVSVDASSPEPGQTTFTAPASMTTCSTSAGPSVIRISYRNLATGAAGDTSVKLCPGPNNPPPTVYTGSGPVVIGVSIAGSSAYPNAGQPSLPGVGGFVAP